MGCDTRIAGVEDVVAATACGCRLFLRIGRTAIPGSGLDDAHFVPGFPEPNEIVV